MNQELHEGLLLNDYGNLNECGYSTKLIKTYNRENITAKKRRIKEWDYYYIGDDNYGIALTIDDNGYMGLTSMSILGFKSNLIVNHANMFWFPFGRVNMPTSSKQGETKKKGRHYYADFKANEGIRELEFRDDNVNGKKFECKFTLKETSPNSLVIATPFDKDKHFYYNQKINNMKAEGYFIYGDLKYEFKDKAYGVLDWGRGVWTYKNTWYWSSMSGEDKDGNIIGFNLGYGFGDTSNASENILFINKHAYKLDDVEFIIPKDDKNREKYLDKWQIVSESGDINLEFTPILDRHDCTNAIILSQDAHQVFGKFNGTFTIGERVVEIKDMIGFAEKVKNKW